MWGSRTSIVSASVKFSDNWENFTAHSLTENMREKQILQQEGNPSNERIKQLQDWYEWLLKVCDGTVSPVIEGTNIKIEVPK